MLLSRRSRIRARNIRSNLIEALEPRTLLSESASAQLHLVSTTGTQASPVFNYDISLTNTGTTPIGTFWFGWIPDENLLPSLPAAESNPNGWGSSVTGSGNSLDGAGIQWVAQGAGLAAGQALDGFTFSSPDSPSVLAGKSVAHSTEDAMASFIYSGAPFSDAGFGFSVTPISAGAAGTTTSLMESVPSITAGNNVQFTATVAPATPGGATPTGTVNFLLNGNSIGSTSVQGDGTAVFSTTSLPVGSDSVTASYGGDTTYAGSTSQAVTETVNSAPAQPALTAVISKSTLPATVVAGESVHGVVNVGLTNVSGATVKGPVMVDLYLSTDGSIDGSSVLIAHATHSLAIATGKSKKAVLPIKSLPSTIADGNYTLLARVVDPSSTPSDSSAGAAVTVSQPIISLSETFTKMTLPQSVAAGAKIHAVAAIKITNTGTDLSSGPTTVALYLSADGQVDGTATLIKSSTKNFKIHPNKSVTDSLSLTEAPSVTPGTYFVIATVTDPKKQLTSVTAANQVTVTT